MNLLIVGNGYTSLIGKKYFKDKHTSSFLEELVQIGYKVTWFEPIHVAIDKQIDLHDRELPSKNFGLLFKTPIKKSKLVKLMFFCVAIVKSLFVLNKINLVYVFIPSRLSIIVATLAILMNKRLAIYVRAGFDSKNILLKFLFKKACFILVTGSYFQNQLVKYNDNVHIVSTMLNLNREDIYKRKISKKSTCNILFVGRIQEAKGIWPMLNAAKLLVDNGISFQLRIVGGGAELEMVRSFIRAEKLTEFVVVYGLVTDKDKLRSFYISSDMFLLPSYVEGVPRVLYEAMTYSLPIITTMVGSIPSIMTDNYNCIPIPPGNSGAIAGAIERLINDIELQTKLSQNALSTIECYFRTKSPLSHAQQVDTLAKGLAL